MKLNFFKFQDGKVFWLPEYPEKNYDTWKTSRHNKLIAQSLVSAIEVAPEDSGRVKNNVFMQNPEVRKGLSISHAWQPEKDKVYSAECEMEIKTVYEPLVSKFDLQFGKIPIGTQLSVARQIARLKPKEEPRTRIHLRLKEEDL